MGDLWLNCYSAREIRTRYFDWGVSRNKWFDKPLGLCAAVTVKCLRFLRLSPRNGPKRTTGQCRPFPRDISQLSDLVRPHLLSRLSLPVITCTPRFQALQTRRVHRSEAEYGARLLGTSFISAVNGLDFTRMEKIIVDYPPRRCTQLTDQQLCKCKRL